MKKVKVIIGILLLISISAGGYIYIKNNLKYKSNTSNLSGYILGDGVEPNLTPEQLRELMQKKVDASKVAFSIYSEPIFKGKKGTIMFANPRYSAHNLDLEVRVDNKVIIRTEKIAPNQYIEEVELKEALPKGTYTGEALVTGYNKETGEKVGETIVEVTITSQ